MKRIMLIVVGVFMVTTAIAIDKLSVDVSAESDNKSTLEVYQQGNGVKAEWAVEMLEEDVLYRTGFEIGDLLPNLHYSNSQSALPMNRWYGGQSFSTEDKYDGEYSLRVHDSYNNGNIYSGRLDGSYLISGVDSWSDFNRSRFYISNSADLSLSFRAKTTGKGEVRFAGTGGAADFGTPLSEKFLEDVKVGDRTVKVSNISRFKSAVDRGDRYHLALSKGRYSYGYVVGYDESNSTITLNTRYMGAFQKGDSVLRHTHRSPVNFSSREIKKEDGWQLFNVNTKVSDYADYNTLNRGFYLTIRTTTRDVVYIDDVKVGHATSAELYRDDHKIYEGYLSDYEDKQATDRAAPNSVNEYSLHYDNGKTYVKIAEPKDNGTSYNYKVRAVSNYNQIGYDSETKEVNVTSGIKGYSYIIDNKKKTTPNGTINSNDGKIKIPNSISAESYLHIQAIDGAGNKSKVTHISLSEIDRTPPEVWAVNVPEEWTRNSVTFILYASDENGIESIIDHKGKTLDFTVRKDHVLVYYTVDDNGEYVFSIEDKAGNETTHSVIIDKIDKESPELTLSKNKNTWTNESIQIKANATDSQSGINAVTLNEKAKDINLISVKDLMKWQGDIFSLNNRNLKISSSSQNMGGFYIPYNFFEDKEDYVLSFEMTKIKGDIPIIGGHLGISDSAEVYIDGVKVEPIRTFNINEWHTGVGYPNDDRKYKIDIKFNVNMIDNHRDKNVYVQANRSAYLHDFEVLYENIMLSKGKEIVKYMPNSLDLIIGENPLVYEAIENGTYEFVATDNAGNTQHKSIVVNNIDKIPPSIEITKSIDTLTHDNIYIYIDAKDEDSGVKSINHLKGNKEHDITHERKVEVRQNGSYTFIVEDNAGNIKIESIAISNIDKSVRLSKPTIEDFSAVNIGEESFTNISGLIIEDWRDELSNWRLQVEATKLTNGKHTLPDGSIQLKGINNINVIESSRGIPKISYDGFKSIDRESVLILESNNARGKYGLRFEPESLKINANENVLKGLYETKITWSIIEAP